MNNELYEKLTRLQWLLRRQRFHGRAHGGPEVDATRGQGRIIAVLKLRDGISTKDLAYMLDVAVSSLNELLGKLEKNGFVTREPSEQDKRVMLVKLTEKGREKEQQEAPDLKDIFDCLTEEEKAAFGTYLDKVFAALSQKLGFSEEDFEKLKAAKAKRDRMFAEMDDGEGRDFGPTRRGFRPGGSAPLGGRRCS
ncbi:MAG: MarR family transcriptional regulator [Eggerthellaceae bacterium]|nr:MarR family transcriptional regulator [Eggerthellaceae bacterium]